MKGYKIFRPDMTCNGMQYAIGQEYRMDKGPVLCKQGYHFCVNPIDLFSYYRFDPNNVVCHIEALGDVVSGDDDSKHATNHIKIRDTIPWGEVLALVNTGKGNSGLGNSGDKNSGNWNSGNRNSGDWNSGDWNSGVRNSGNWNSGDWNSGHYNSGNKNSGDWNSGDKNSGNWNSGHYNSGNRHAGFFCTGEARMTLFNKPTDLTCREVANMLPYIKLNPCTWVNSDDMSDYEKEKHPEHETTGGYLKTRSLKESWQEWWSEADDDSRQKILSLPNFDAEIFHEITGIAVEVPDA